MQPLEWSSLPGRGIHFLRVLWCDNANVIRGKAVRVRNEPDPLGDGVGISPAQQGLPVIRDAFLPDSGVGPVGEIRLVPDWTTARFLPWANGHARVLGDMMLDQKPWALCPRHALKRQIQRLQARGLTVKAAFENEFFLLRPEEKGQPQPADRTPFCSVYAMNQNRQFVDDLCNALEAQDMLIEQYYPESGWGQHEVSVRYTDPLATADNQIALRETVHAIAHQHGLIASFLPKIYGDQAGSGCHLHLSLHKDGQPHMDLKGEPGHFIAGILHHLSALMALTTPIPNSYRRIQPHFWSGAYACWGNDNREAAVRWLTQTDHFELKTVDASANPYLALAGILAAGNDGIEKQTPLPEPVAIDPGLYSDEERRQKNIPRLSENLHQALEHLQQDATLLDALGPQLAQAYLAIKREEAKHYSEMSLAEEVQQLLDRY